MTRLYLRLAVLPFLFFVVVLVIHAQPYDKHKLPALLMTDGCPMPCFMGIRPGITNESDAIRLLKASGWLGSYEYVIQQNAVRFTWTGDTPAWLVNDGSYNGVLYLNNGLVNQLAVQTNLRIGDFQLGLGQPAFQQSSMINSGTGYYLFYTATYPDEKVLLNVTRDCTVQKRKINYLDKVFLSYATVNIEAMFPSTMGRTWSDVVKRSCPR